MRGWSGGGRKGKRKKLAAPRARANIWWTVNHSVSQRASPDSAKSPNEIVRRHRRRRSNKHLLPFTDPPSSSLLFSFYIQFKETNHATLVVQCATKFVG
uniref:Uncharacterized protein n=1 Tax=Caenorhabditis japonica TaxID=281687 RepID=A0A8R1J1A5_CAEJA